MLLPDIGVIVANANDVHKDDNDLGNNSITHRHRLWGAAQALVPIIVKRL